MKFGDLTYLEIKGFAEDGWIAIVPTGCTEQQGPHLPVDTDTWFVETVCLAASEQAAKQYSAHSLVLPALPFGPTPEHKGFGSGYIHLPQETHETVVRAILNSLTDQGFRRIILWKGCGQHQLGRVVNEFNIDQQGICRAFYSELPYHEIWCAVGDPDIPGGHADSFITSITMHLRPGVVRKDLIANPQNEPVDWGDAHLDFSKHSSTGVIGDPTKASIELGAKLWATIVNEGAETIRECAHMPIE